MTILNTDANADVRLVGNHRRKSMSKTGIEFSFRLRLARKIGAEFGFEIQMADCTT